MILHFSILSLFYNLKCNFTSSYYCFFVLVTSTIFKYLKTNKKIKFHQLENCTLITIDLGFFSPLFSCCMDSWYSLAFPFLFPPKRKNDQHPIQEHARKGMHGSMEKSYRVSSPRPLMKSMQFRQPSNLQLEQPNFPPGMHK